MQDWPLQFAAVLSMHWMSRQMQFTRRIRAGGVLLASAPPRDDGLKELRMLTTPAVASLDKRAKLIRSLPDLASQQQTATGPIMFKELVGVAMPIPLALMIGRELACVTVGKRVAVRSSFVAKLEAEQHQATLANYLTGVTYSIAAMPVPARLDFLVAVCDFIQRVRDATGFESILSRSSAHFLHCAESVTRCQANVAS